MEKDTAVPVITEEENPAALAEGAAAPGLPQEENLETVPQAETAPKPSAPKRSIPLVPILAVFLLVLGICELIFWSFAGLRVYLDDRERRLLEDQRTANASQGLRGQVSVSSTPGTSQGGTGSSNEEFRLSALSVSRIPYDLAEQEPAPGTDPTLPRLSVLSVPRIPYDLAEDSEQEPDAGLG